MATKTKNKSEYLFDDEIDLTPYINRVMAKKWLIVVITAAITVGTYGASFLLPEAYQVNTTLTFGGEASSTDSSGKSISTTLVSPTYVEGLLDSFAQEATNGNSAGELSSVEIEGTEYPLEVTFRVAEGVGEAKYPEQLLSYLNGNDYVENKLSIEETRINSSLETKEADLTDVNAKIDGTTSSTAYAELVTLKTSLDEEIAELQQAKDSLTGFTYSVKPYFANKGSPVSPKKTQNAGIAGFLALSGTVVVVAFKEDKSKSKKGK